jgi:hypothetical protein
MLNNILVTYHDSRWNSFFSYVQHKLNIFTNSRAKTLKILNISTQKYPGAQLHMLINIPVRFNDSRSNIFWVTCHTSWKLQIFTQSRAITLKILNISTWKYPVHNFTCWSTFLWGFMTQIRSIHFWATCHTKKENGQTEGRTRVIKSKCSLYSGGTIKLGPDNSLG